nr:putative mediator of RNA polymerase II transcription subunit 26 [Arachis hypogaea]
MSSRKALDYSSGGSLQMMKTAQEAHDLIDMVANNEYFYSSERQAASKRGVFELEGVDTILAQNRIMHQQLQQQIEMMSKKMDGLQLAAVSTTTQPPILWGQHEESYEEQQPEQVQYMHNQGAGQNDFYGDTYNSSWRNHPNLKWGENQNHQPWSGKTLENDKGAGQKQVEEDEHDKESSKKKEKEPQASKKGKQVMEEHPHEQRKEVKPYIPPLPYPQRLQRELKDQQFSKFLEIFKKVEINIPLAKALEQMPLYAKFLKKLINKKRSWNEKETVILTKECTAVIQKGLPPNLKDPVSFFLP